MDQARRDLEAALNWWKANPVEMVKVLGCNESRGAASLWLTDHIGNDLARLTICSECLIEVAKFGIAFGYFMGKTSNFGTDVPDVFKEE